MSRFGQENSEARSALSKMTFLRNVILGSPGLVTGTALSGWSRSVRDAS